MSETRVGGNALFVGMPRRHERKAAEDEIRNLNASLESMIAAESSQSFPSRCWPMPRDRIGFFRPTNAIPSGEPFPWPTLPDFRVDGLVGPHDTRATPSHPRIRSTNPSKVFETGQAIVGTEARGWPRFDAPFGKSAMCWRDYYPVLDAQGDVISAGTAIVDITST